MIEGSEVRADVRTQLLNLTFLYLSNAVQMFHLSTYPLEQVELNVTESLEDQ